VAKDKNGKSNTMKPNN